MILPNPLWNLCTWQMDKTNLESKSKKTSQNSFATQKKTVKLPRTHWSGWGGRDLSSCRFGPSRRLALGRLSESEVALFSVRLLPGINPPLARRRDKLPHAVTEALLHAHLHTYYYSGGSTIPFGGHENTISHLVRAPIAIMRWDGLISPRVSYYSFLFLLFPCFPSTIISQVLGLIMCAGYL